MSKALDLLVMRGDKPLHLQIADQIQEKILNGALSVGSRLPTVRKLATSAGVSRVTALLAYEALQLRGLVQSRVGSGTYVAAPMTREGGKGRLRTFKPCAVTSDYADSARSAGITNLAIADADDRLFHADEFAAGMLRSRNQSVSSSAYGEGGLLTAAASYYRSVGIEGDPESMVVTGGGIATNAALVLSLPRGSRIGLQDPAFPHAEDYFASFGVEVVGLPTCSGELDLDRFAEEAKAGLKAAFLFPAVNQCTGESASKQNKRQTIEVAEKYGVGLFEDYSAFWTASDARPRALFELGEGASIDIVGFDCMTKSLGRTVPMSFVFAKGRARDRLAVRSMGLGSAPPSMMQHALRVYFESRSFSAHIARSTTRHFARRQAVLKALSERMPSGVSWSQPIVGHSIWVQFPSHVDESRLYEDALTSGVAVAPGMAACCPRRPVSAVRLSYGSASVDEITLAVTRLAQVAERHIGLV